MEVVDKGLDERHPRDLCHHQRHGHFNATGVSTPRVFQRHWSFNATGVSTPLVWLTVGPSSFVF